MERSYKYSVKVSEFFIWDQVTRCLSHGVKMAPKQKKTLNLLKGLKTLQNMSGKLT